ncbi:Phosphoglycerate mutase [Madurella fahalii]|uniref:Phosphoglycerate mutase n=1 Tax=Madurella fahalii TaxID=1157608 RepID=A0ABQ0GKF9_9PEZI
MPQAVPRHFHSSSQATPQFSIFHHESSASKGKALEKTCAVIHILRHGQALHNVDKSHLFPDPSLTETGQLQARNLNITTGPDLVLISPMTRTLQTALLAFDSLEGIEIRVWPDLREAHNALCNKGIPKADLAAQFPQFDYTECHDEWDYPDHSTDEAVARAERVRKRVKDLSTSYGNIYLVTHRGFIAFLVQGEKFDVCEHHQYRFAAEDEVGGGRYGVNRDTGLMQDFGPTLLLPTEGHENPTGDLDVEGDRQE